MAVEKQYLSDVETILAHRYDLGADLWTSPDKRLIKGSPFSTLECVMYLVELGMDTAEVLIQQSAELIFSTWQEDGRFKLYPDGAIYPCQTINAASVLCHLGFQSDERLVKTFQHLLEIQELDGGWRCKKFSYGHGPETAYSNPFPTLMALDAFRFTEHANNHPALDGAVDFLLNHWAIKTPLGPCHYGIGSLFMQVEYPFRGYNLFQYVTILSYYERARKDDRFLEAFNALTSKLRDGKLVVERVVPKLSRLSFCKKGEPSDLATKRYREILERIGR